MLIAFETAQLLEEHGFRVLGPYKSVDDAMSGIDHEKPDAAILDINLGNGRTSEPLAEALIGEVPFAFLTGYGSGLILSQKFDDIVKLRKPVRTEELITVAKTLTEQVR